MEYNIKTNPHKLCNELRVRVIHPNLVNGFHEKYYPGRFAILGSCRYVGSKLHSVKQMDELDLIGVSVATTVNDFLMKQYKLRDFIRPGSSLLFHGYDSPLSDIQQQVIDDLGESSLIGKLLVIGMNQHLEFNKYELQNNSQCRDDYLRSKKILSSLLMQHEILTI